MFSLYTTEDTLTQMCEERKEWWDILNDQQYVCISTENGGIWDMSNRVLLNLHKAGVHIDMDNDLINDIKADHSKVYDLPNPYYIIDIDKQTALSIESQYGVVCRPLSEYNSNPLVRSGWNLDTTNPRKRQGWDAFFDGIDIPVNSLIIIDRYLFSSEVGETINDSIYNIRGILDAVLPIKAKDNVVHVAIVFDGDSIKESDGVTFSQLLTKVNSLKKNLRTYPFTIELISINSDCYNYKETHDRYILSNYFTVDARHKIKAYFTDNSHTCGQILNFNYLYSTGVGNDKRSSTPEYTLHRVLQAIYESITTSKNEILHGCNGQVSKKGDFTIKNRFFQYQFS